MKVSNKTIEYYNKNADAYFEMTSKAKMFASCDRFLLYLENNSTILDFGCGSGRDTKYFMEKGFNVHGIDGSIEMCKRAKENSGCLNIECVDFLSFDRKEMYDGIFACASLLHLNVDELCVVFHKLIDACFNHGVIYASFKYGDFEGYRDERYYTDMNETKMLDLIYEYEDLSIEDMWVSKDVIGGREGTSWLNVILRVIK